MKNTFFSVFIAMGTLLLLWISLSGHFNALQIGLGLLSSIAVVLLTMRLKILTTEGSRLKLLPNYPVYLIWLIKEIIKSNLSVAKIVLSPNMPLCREIVRTRPKQMNDLAATIYANSITLTPGTVTINVIENDFVVHSLAKQFTVGILSNEMNDKVTTLESEFFTKK